VKCPACKRAPSGSPTIREQSAFEVELNQQRRQWTCACGYKVLTVEIEQAELSRLRRLAYLYSLTSDAGDASHA
jgi:hypothetical protein